MQKVLASEQKEWEKYHKEEIAEKEKEEKQSRIEDALENTKQQLKEVEKPLENEVTTDEQLPQDAKELKSKLKLQYEEMKMAFGPDGGGFTNAIRIAKDYPEGTESLYFLPAENVQPNKGDLSENTGLKT